MAMIMRVAEMGRVKKMEKLPFDIMSDWRNAFSIMGPRTNAKIRGGVSSKSFFITYPITPNMSMISISVELLLIE